MVFEGVQRPLSERDDSQGARCLAVGAKPPADQNPPDVEDFRVAVDVAPLERQQLRGP